MMYWNLGFGFLPMILFCGLVIYGIYFLVKQTGIPEKHNPLDILKVRFVKGEITREEFESMKRDIK